MLNDALYPLAASYITRDLHPDQRVALTAAAALMSGPLSLAPAVVAFRRAQDEAAAEKGTTLPVVVKQPQPPLGPRLAPIPMVVNEKIGDAKAALEAANNFVGKVVGYNISEEAKKDVVLVQKPPADEEQFPEGTVVELRVGYGEKQPAVDELSSKITTGIEPILAGLDAMAKAHAAQQVTFDQKLAEAVAPLGGQLAAMNQTLTDSQTILKQMLSILTQSQSAQESLQASMDALSLPTGKGPASK
ncbi:MAG: PASTA domain-containing protein [Alphaproteobacteria bacterium]